MVRSKYQPLQRTHIVCWGISSVLHHFVIFHWPSLHSIREMHFKAGKEDESLLPSYLCIHMCHGKDITMLTHILNNTLLNLPHFIFPWLLFVFCDNGSVWYFWSTPLQWSSLAQVRLRWMIRLCHDIKKPQNMLLSVDGTFRGEKFQKLLSVYFGLLFVSFS
jgi:hypothetical protein